MERRLSWSELGLRPILFPALFFCVGAWSGPQLQIVPWIFLLAALPCGLCAALLSGRTGAHLCLLLASLLAGGGLSTLAAQVEVPEALAEGGRAIVEGELTEVAQVGDSTRLELRVARAAGAPAALGLRLYARGKPPQVHPGQRVVVPARLKPLAEVANPGEPDFRSRQVRRGLVFTGGADPARVVALKPASGYRVWLRRTHRALAAQAHALAPTKEAAALYLTLAAGLRAELGEELEDQFSRSGLAHVLSVSGLHVAVLAVALVRLLRFLLSRFFAPARRLDVRRLAAPLAVPLVWGYVLFTGNQMPAVRSAVMATAVLLAMALWRRADALNALALAGLALVALEPSAVADLSTQLSFLAVASLIIVAPAVRELVPIPRPDPHSRPHWRYRLAALGEAAVATFCASVAVTLASAPLIAGAFGRLSAAGLISNVVTLPLSGVLTLLAAGGAFLFALSPALALPVVWAGTWASQLLVAAATAFATVPGAALPARGFGVGAGLLFVTALFGWALGRGKARWALGALVPAAVAVAFVLPRLLPAPGMSVTFLSVGHGDAVVVQSAGRTLLVDGGGVPGGADPAERFVLPFLRHVGVEAVDLAVLSHPHPDHALGLITVLERLPVARLWLPAGDEGGELGLQILAAAGDAQVEEVEAGRAPYRLGEVSVEVLGPPPDRILLEGVNDRSVVLRLVHGEVTVLLAGDVEAAGEAALHPGPITVMKVPHHGSSTSSSRELLERTRPRVAVFCVGRNNRFGFPDPEVVQRYVEVGAACYRTDRHGAVTVESDGRSVRVRTFLEAGEEAPRVARAPADAQR